MNKKNIICTSMLSLAMLSGSAFALEFGKPITTTIDLAGSTKKNITLMNIILSPHEQKALFTYEPKAPSELSLAKEKSNLPSAVDLGMNNVPVLDQGAHGTCVTFAVTAAIDAILGKGDYVSQLCNLELGATLADNGYLPSGWDGSWGPWVLEQVLRFGIISKENQLSKTCASVNEYPLKDDRATGHPMEITEFKSLSESLLEKMYWVHLMNNNERFSANFSNNEQMDKVIYQVKTALSKGNRVTFGTFLVLSPYCSAGACASYKANNDTWALTREINTPPFGMGGHEMVITGYDDNAMLLDHSGKKHKGLFIIRNSWSERAGNKGTYYMTYDYFKKFALEAQEMVASPTNM